MTMHVNIISSNILNPPLISRRLQTQLKPIKTTRVQDYICLIDFKLLWTLTGAFLVAQMVKNLPAKWETWVWSLGWEDILKMEMATHSSILTWKISWTEEPGGLLSMRSQRVRHNWATEHFYFQTLTSSTKIKTSISNKIVTRNTYLLQCFSSHRHILLSRFLEFKMNTYAGMITLFSKENF